MEYSYQEGDQFWFMDTETYEQVSLPQEIIGDVMGYIPHNSQVKVSYHDGVPVTVELPASVELKIVETDPGYRGNTVTNVQKPAKLETGLEIKVPPHINTGDVIKVDTRTGEFLERVSTAK
jgi:elongation factor P